MVQDHRVTNQFGNYFKKISVTNTTFGVPTDGYTQDVFFNFVVQGFTLDLESTGRVLYSFDGITTAGDLDSTQASKSRIFQARIGVGKIWFSLASGTGTVRVEAWSIP